MNLDYATLDGLRVHHPAWRLLRSEHAPLIASFLQRAFIKPNVRMLPAADLAEALEDELFALREKIGPDAFPKSAHEYLNDWANPDKGWLRKFYRQGSDEAQFDLTPATEKAIAWLGSLAERSFVGTESRLLTLFDLLKQMSEGSQTDPARRIAELQARRDEIDAEMARVLGGDVPVLDDSALRDRFQQFQQIARELLGDFREVEHNFRLLDRRVRERIALWEGSKGELLAEIMGERDAIADSDQGRSFRAFWDFLMSSQRQEELSERLEEVLALPAVRELKPDARTRRFLDDKAWLENRRIMDILRGIEGKAIALRGQLPVTGQFMQIADTAADIDLPMERPLYTPRHKPKIADLALDLEDLAVDASALYGQIVVDKAALARNIRHALQDRSQITLKEICERNPLAHGLAELVAYLQLGSDQFKVVIDEDTLEVISWVAEQTGINRRARLPRVIFVR